MSEVPLRFFIIDGMSLLFRSFYAMGTKLSTPDGIPIGAVYGFLKVMIKILREQNPTHFAVCWDLKEKTFRHKMYPLYKANRSETPPDIVPQIPLIQNILKEIGLPSFSLAGFEADDVAATLAKYFEHYGDVFLVTSDKDYMQIVNEKIKLFSLKKGDDYDIIGAEKVIDYFGVPPEKVIEVLGMAGDTSDNVPGIKGIGQKTAAKLINDFGSIENLYNHLNSVLNKRVKEILTNQKEAALLSKQLVTLDCSVPIEFTEHALRYTFDSFKEHPDLKQKLSDLHMQGLVKSLFGDAEVTPQKPVDASLPFRSASSWTKASIASALTHGASPEQVFETLQDGDDKGAPEDDKIVEYRVTWQRNYSLVATTNQLDSLLKKIIDPETVFFAFDTETTGLDIIDDFPIGISLCFEAGTAYYIPLHTQHAQEYSLEEAKQKLAHAFSERRAFAVAHNLKFDLHQLKNIGIELGDVTSCCTMVAAWLCNSAEGGFSLDFLTAKHFNLQKIPTSSLIGKGTGRSSMLDVPLLDLTEYACEDVDATFRLWSIYRERLQQNTVLQKIYFEMEMPVLILLADMERTGVHVDSRYLRSLAAEIEKNLRDIEEKIYIAVGFAFKITSPKQLGTILFEHLKVHEYVNYKGKLARTTQGYKTDAGVLEQFEEHPVVSLIQQHRELSKLLSTYVRVLPDLVKLSTGRVHTHFNQIGTATGRLSSSDPNLQNIPVRSDWGKRVRAAFTPSSPHNTIISADYSQIELRVLAHLSGDENMVCAFQAGADIHRQTAAQILDKKIEDVSLEERNSAKAINFGIIYGMGPGRLAKEQKISLSKAKEFIERYFINFSGVKKYLDDQRAAVHTSSVVKTYFGRERPLPQIQSKNSMEAKFAENMAINSPIQGTAADIMKLGMLAVYKELQQKKLQTKIIIQVHDELVLDGPLSEFEEVQQILRTAMQNVVLFTVPMLVDIGNAENWLEAK